jgi:hypothetical protein
MYSPSAYFFAGWIIAIINVAFYPIIISTFSFYFVNFNDSSGSNFLNWLTIVCLQAFCGATFGFMYGCVFDNEQVAL